MTYVNRELADKYQDFFNFMNQEHNLILTKEEMDEILSEAERLVKKLTMHDVVGRSEQFYCTCSRAKGLDHDEEGTPYCISCQKKVQF